MRQIQKPYKAKKAWKAIENISCKRKKQGLLPMSMEEINAEIALMHKEQQAQKELYEVQVASL